MKEKASLLIRSVEDKTETLILGRISVMYNDSIGYQNILKLICPMVATGCRLKASLLKLAHQIESCIWMLVIAPNLFRNI